MRIHHLSTLLALTTLTMASSISAALHDSPNTETINSSVLPKRVAINNNEILVENDARWEQVAGCARDIAAGDNGVVYVTGCDVVPNSYGSSAFYRWNGAAFAPLSSPGHGSAIATLAGTSYTIGGDAKLYSSNNDGAF